MLSRVAHGRDAFTEYSTYPSSEDKRASAKSAQLPLIDIVRKAQRYRAGGVDTGRHGCEDRCSMKCCDHAVVIRADVRVWDVKRRVAQDTKRFGNAITGVTNRQKTRRFQRRENG